MRIRVFVLALICSVGLFSCSKRTEKIVTLKNPIEVDRQEVISIPLGDLTDDSTAQFFFRVNDGDSVRSHQVFDNDGDSLPDQLLVYLPLKARETKELRIEISRKKLYDPKMITYSRFVPERTDDYTWENDLVAFRTYGPTAQRLVEEGKQGGTLSSGLDCWLKRVRYPIIDKWYKKYTEGGTYHKDDGEGYDPYHVGKSRGCGGIGVWQNDSLYVSKNFVSYQAIVNGPIRNIFELTYAPWNAGGSNIEETKRITIDAGNQLYKVEEVLKSDGVIPNVTIGITLHDKKGIVEADSLNGIFSYWEPVDDSEIGTGVIVDPSTLLGHEDFRTGKKDLSQLYVVVKPSNRISYHTGFAWKKAGAITTAGAWKNYLLEFKQRQANPIIVEVTQ